MALRVLSCFCLLTCATTAHATESGVGRPVTGQVMNPMAGIVPPDPGGVFVTFSSIYYDATSGGNVKLANGKYLTAEAELKVSYDYLSLTKVWNTGPGQWNFASGIALPVQYSNATAQVQGPSGRFDKHISDSSTEMADVLLVPISAGYHFSPTEHMALSLLVYAPTGSYDKDRLANAGQNTWTFIPTLAYTKILPESNVELSASWGMEFYTPNSATEYHNGILNTLDANVIKRFSSGWGGGLVFGWIQQLTDDTGGLANTLGGDRGRSVGLGPILTWQGKAGTTPVSASLRWVNEFDVANRPRGNSFQLNATGQF